MTHSTSQSAPEEGWHYVGRSEQGDKAVGPVGDEQIIDMVRGGALNHTSLVWRKGMAEWTTLAQIPQLASHIAAPPTQPGALNDRQWSDSDQRMGDNLGIRMLIPVGRSGWAIASGYLGLFSVLVVPAPLALITGLIAIWDIRTHEHRHGYGRAVFGIIAGAAGTIVMAFVGVGAALGF